ncbi:MAG: signal peptidase II [Pseudomonadota bacterium]
MLWAAAWYAIDQVSKWAVIQALSASGDAIRVTPFFRLVLGWNDGVSFGLFGGSGVPPWILAALSTAIAVAVLVWLGRATTFWIRAAAGLVGGGALANATDRLRFGAVTDFLDFHVWSLHWPAFNLADTGIVVGTGLLMLHSLGGDAGRAEPGIENRRETRNTPDGGRL